jgi:hypothetical protein
MVEVELTHKIIGGPTSSNFEEGAAFGETGSTLCSDNGPSFLERQAAPFI